MTNSIPKPGPGPMHISNPIAKKDSIMVNTAKYVRKPFEVQAVQVTEENFEDVASWCGGTIVTTRAPKEADELTETEEKRYIKVNVSRPLNERQTQAFVGDWLLEAEKGLKVYADGPFTRNFALVPSNDTPQELFVTTTTDE